MTARARAQPWTRFHIPWSASPAPTSPSIIPSPGISRRTFLIAGLIASNAPDFDIFYSGITPAPLGYLLHHRGHTHTILGLVGLSLLIATVFALVPSVRQLSGGSRRRLWLVIACAIASHLVLDFANVNGLHPFSPYDSGWVFGDAAFTFEPWVWITLGVSAAWNARTKLGRWRLLAMLTLLPTTLSVVGLIAGEAAAAVFAVGAGCAWLARRRSPRQRAVVALAATAAVLGSLFALSGLAHTRVHTLLDRTIDAQPLDTVLIPNPGLPVCWTFIVVAHDPRAQDLVHYRGTLSLLPAWRAAANCASHRIMHPPETTIHGGGAVALVDVVRQPIEELRLLRQRDCFVRAWLQFGRVPVVDGRTIRDLRFDGLLRENFTVLTVSPVNATRACPSFMTSWAAPRGDVLDTLPPIAAP